MMSELADSDGGASVQPSDHSIISTLEVDNSFAEDNFDEEVKRKSLIQGSQNRHQHNSVVHMRPTIAVLAGRPTTIIQSSAGNAHSAGNTSTNSIGSSLRSSDNEQSLQVRTWTSYLYTHCQPHITEVSSAELHSNYHKSYEEIKWYLYFIDLVFVSVVYNTEHLISKCGSSNFKVYLMAISFFSIVFITRHCLDLYASTFVRIQHGIMPLLQNDIIHRLSIILYGFGIFSMAINIDAEKVDSNASFGSCVFKLEYTFSFAVGFILCRVILIVWNILLLHYSNLETMSTRYRFTLISRIFNAFLACLLIIPTTTPQYEYSLQIFPFIAALGFFEEIIRKLNIIVVKTFNRYVLGAFCEVYRKDFNCVNFQVRVKERIAKSKAVESMGEVFVDFATLVERLGLIFVLVLGEAIIGLSFSGYDQNRTNNGRLTEFSAYLLVACYATQFFETLDVTTPDLHSLRGGIYLGTFFYLLNILASFDLLVAIAGLIQLYNHVVGNDEETVTSVNEASWQLSFGLFLTQMILISLRFSHKLHLRRSVRRGLNIRQKLKILYQLNFRARLSNYEIASIAVFLVSSWIHLLIYPVCRHGNCYSDAIITAHAVVAAVFSAVYLLLQAIDQRKKEQEYVYFQERRRQVIKRVITTTTTTTTPELSSQLLAGVARSDHANEN